MIVTLKAAIKFVGVDRSLLGRVMTLAGIFAGQGISSQSTSDSKVEEATGDSGGNI